MSDSVRLEVDGKSVENLLTYAIAADLYQAADAFTMELADPGVSIRGGQLCKVYVNGNLELAGLVDKVTRRYDKSGRKLTVQGRDKMGILVDSYAERFVAVEGMRLKALAEMLVAPLPFINRSDIEYQENIRGTLKRKGKKEPGGEASLVSLLDKSQKLARIEPGKTVFEILKQYAESRGLIFFLVYRDNAAKFVFGRPKAAGGDPAFSLVCRKSDPSGNNILIGEHVDDVSGRYSRIVVMGQQQGDDSLSPGQHSTYKVFTDEQAPVPKTLVVTNNNDYQSPALHARMLMEKARLSSSIFTYTVPGHSQAGNNFRINELCRVVDEELDVDGVYLIYERTFKRTLQDGTTTELTLGPPGVLKSAAG